MPAKCVKCDEVFDMSYDQCNSETSSEKTKKFSELMCWECRKSA
jgi:hypothetical protein